MRQTSVGSEVWRNLVSGTSRAGVLALVFVAVVGGLAFADVRAVVRVLEDAESFRDSGAAVQTLATANAVDGAQCEAIDSAPGIAASGALRQGAPLRALSLPASELSVWDVSPGLLGVLTESTATTGITGSSGIWLSDDLAEALGAVPGERIETSIGPVDIAGIYTWPDDGRDRLLGYSVLAPVPADNVFEQCWAQVWPADKQLVELLYMALGSETTAGSDARVTQLNPQFGAEFDAVELIANRVTRWTSLAAVVAGAGLGYAAVRFRRLEIASSMHAGVSKTALGWQHLAEAVIWISCALLICSAFTIISARYGSHDASLGPWFIGLRVMGVGALSAIIGTLVGVVLTRERHLFVYFKDR